MNLACAAILVPVLLGAAAMPARAATAADFTQEVRALARVAACAPEGDIPPALDARVVAAHCRDLAVIARDWRQRWLARAQPFLAEVVPDGLPRRVVYPFGGGDLVTALVTFPRASEITTLSLEPTGDPRALDAFATLDPAALQAALEEVRISIRKLLAVSHSKTVVMGQMARGRLPGDLTYTLVGFMLTDMVPVAVRFFRVREDGALDYLTADALPAAGLNKASREPFANVEIIFQPRAGGERRVFRHIAANLDDPHLAADPSVLRHLEQKGEVTAMTKAASYLLWWREFSTMRRYLLSHMAWMISDSTGIPTVDAQDAGFEQIAYGRFEGPFLGNSKRPIEAFRKLWAGAPPLTFRFGYPDSGGNSHLMVTRRPAATAGMVAEAEAVEAAPVGVVPIGTARARAGKGATVATTAANAAAAEPAPPSPAGKPDAVSPGAAPMCGPAPAP